MAEDVGGSHYLASQSDEKKNSSVLRRGGNQWPTGCVMIVAHLEACVRSVALNRCFWIKKKGWFFWVTCSIFNVSISSLFSLESPATHSCNTWMIASTVVCVLFILSIEIDSVQKLQLSHAPVQTSVRWLQNVIKLDVNFLWVHVHCDFPFSKFLKT